MGRGELRKEWEQEGTGKSIPLSVEITENTWKDAKAGTYTGGVKFTAELVNK